MNDENVKINPEIRKKLNIPIYINVSMEIIKKGQNDGKNDNKLENNKKGNGIDMTSGSFLESSFCLRFVSLLLRFVFFSVNNGWL